jgi:hypothetical protein
VTSCQGKGGTGTLYSYAQLEGLWINAGGPRALAPVAAAIAEAESGGCSTALNPTDNGGTQSSFGLWQISNGTHNPPAANIYDAAVNAAQAVAKYKGAGNSFAPWGTYNSGAYKAYLSGSTTPDTNVPAGGGAAGGTATAQLTSATQKPDPSCAFTIGSINPFSGIPVIGSIQIGSGICLMHKSTIRHLVGGLLLAGAAVPAGLGVILLGAFAFRASGAAAAAGEIAGTIRPAGGAYRRYADRDLERRGMPRNPPKPPRARKKPPASQASGAGP